MSLGIDDQTLFFGFRESFDALALDLRRLEDGGDQFFLAARDFGLLHLDLRLALNLLYPDGFGSHLLLHDIGFDFVGLVGLRLGLLGGLQKIRALDVQVALRLSLLRERRSFRGDAFLVSLSLGNG